jgi:hypothetical protein
MTPGLDVNNTTDNKYFTVNGNPYSCSSSNASSIQSLFDYLFTATPTTKVMTNCTITTTTTEINIDFTGTQSILMFDPTVFGGFLTNATGLISSTTGKVLKFTNSNGVFYPSINKSTFDNCSCEASTLNGCNFSIRPWGNPFIINGNTYDCSALTSNSSSIQSLFTDILK